MTLRLKTANALFLHVPFCGGQWVRSALAACGIEIEDAVQPSGLGSEHGLRSHYEDRSTTAFMVVRHPLTWYQSYWTRFHRTVDPRATVREEFQHSRRFLPYTLLHRHLTSDFNVFMFHVMGAEPAFVSRMYEWYAGPPGAVQVERVAGLENLTSDLRCILTALGYSVSLDQLEALPRVNVRDPTIHCDLDVSLRDRLVQLERPAFDRFYRDE